MLYTPSWLWKPAALRCGQRGAGTALGAGGASRSQAATDGAAAAAAGGDSSGMGLGAGSSPAGRAVGGDTESRARERGEGERAGWGVPWVVFRGSCGRCGGWVTGGLLWGFFGFFCFQKEDEISSAVAEHSNCSQADVNQVLRTLLPDTLCCKVLPLPPAALLNGTAPNSSKGSDFRPLYVFQAWCQTTCNHYTSRQNGRHSL